MKNKEVKQKEIKGLSIYNFLLEEKYIPSDVILISYLYNIIKNRKNKVVSFNINAISKATNLSEKTIRNRFNDLCRIGKIKFSKDKKTIRFNDIFEEYLSKSNTTFFIPNDILFNKDLTDKQKLILSYIVGFTSHDKECTSFNKTIMNTLNVSEATLKTALSKFKKLGLIDSSLSDTGRGFIKKRKISANMEAINNYYITVNNDNRQYTMNQTIFNIGKVDNSKNITNNITVTLQIPEDATEEQRLNYIREFMNCVQNKE